MTFRLPRPVFVLGLCLATLVGCDAKKSTNANREQTRPSSSRGSEAQALVPLESKQDLETIRNAIGGLENLASAGERPVWTDAEKAELVKFCRLNEAESADVAQRAFSPADSAYLEECLLIRMALRNLAPERLSPMVRAQIAFDWACRAVYIDNRVPWPAPPWQTLQSGSGIALSRAYVVLAAWRQLGLDGCLIGPADLQTTPSLKVGPDGQPRFAPVRLCGLRMGKDILLFDHATGQTLRGADKSTPLTLAQAKAAPGTLASIATESEIATWKAYLAPPIQGLSRRMEWLEALSPGAPGIRLFVNVLEERNRFAKEVGGEISVWCQPGDASSPGRIVAKYQEEEGEEPQRVSLRVRHRVLMVPREYLPETALEGNAKAMVTMSFARWFENLRYTAGSPRDLQLRGNYKEALSGLDETSNQISNARQRIEQDKSLRQDFDRFVDELQSLTAAYYRVKDDPAASAAARKRIESFQSVQRNVDIERSFVLGTAARPLGAEVLFLTASAVHERCERAEAEGSGNESSWRNAIDCWDRFLSVAANTRASFPGREPHAKLMKARCESFVKK